MILLSELSRRRIRSINKLIRVGRNECVVVIRVDTTKGYIDLSKRRVSAEDIARCEQKFACGKAVNSILRHVAELLKYNEEQLEDLYKKTAWYYDEKHKKQGYAYEIFKHAVTEPSVLDECDITDEVKAVLLDNIKRRLTPQAVKIRADIEVACYGYEGIDAVKYALRKGIACSTEEMPIKINLIAPPLYVITTTTLEHSDGLKALHNAIEKIDEAIIDLGGVFKIQMAPKVVTDLDELDLAKRIKEAEAEITEVDGDYDDEEAKAPSDDEKENGIPEAADDVGIEI